MYKCLKIHYLNIKSTKKGIKKSSSKVSRSYCKRKKTESDNTVTSDIKT